MIDILLDERFRKRYGNPCAVTHRADIHRAFRYRQPCRDKLSEAGPLLIIAGAGSGKTNTLAYCVAHLVFSGVDPPRILLLTFSRRAAEEMVRRAGHVLSQALDARGRRRNAELPWAGTFHSVGARLLREYDRIGLNESFTIHDRGDSEDLRAIVRHQLGLSETKNRFPTKGTCLAIYSRAVNSGVSLGDVLKNTFPRSAQWEDELRRFFDAYVGEKQSQNVLDYDDLLLYWSQTVGEPDLGRAIGERFDHVLVDEYQDTNRLQASILLGMKPNGEGLTVDMPMSLQPTRSGRSPTRLAVHAFR